MVAEIDAIARGTGQPAATLIIEIAAIAMARTRIGGHADLLRCLPRGPWRIYGCISMCLWALLHLWVLKLSPVDL